MLKKCEKCGRFFGDEDSSNVCTACRLSTRNFKSTGDLERDKFIATRELVYENPDISPQGIVDIMAEMGVNITIREIMRYVDEGRLTLSTVAEGNHCLGCGTKLAFGKYCDRCRAKIARAKPIESSDSIEDDDKNRVRMHIAEKKK